MAVVHFCHLSYINVMSSGMLGHALCANNVLNNKNLLKQGL